MALPDAACRAGYKRLSIFKLHVEPLCPPCWSGDCAVIRPQNLQAISPQNEVKKLAEIILDDAAIRHDLGDKIELVR